MTFQIIENTVDPATHIEAAITKEFYKMEEEPDSFIVGVKAIAQEFGLTTSQVYNLSFLRAQGKSKFPVWKERGLGLVTTKNKAREFKNAPPSSIKKEKSAKTVG